MIESIRSFAKVRFDDLPPKSLVVFDVDETLITPADILLKPAGRGFKGWEKINPEQILHYLTIMLASETYILVDDNIPGIIQNLFPKGISAIGLTACSTGAVGVIQSMEKWRFDQLKAVGIDFSPFFPEEYVFSELVVETSRPPIFKKGILFTGDFQAAHKSTKGELLGVLFDRMNWRPEQVVFIDDDRKHVEAVRDMLGQRKIPFRGYLMERPLLELNEKVAEFQIQTLLDSNKWISDKQAKILGLLEVKQ